MPKPVGLNCNVNYVGNNLPGAGSVNNAGNAGNIANAGNNAAPGLDAAGRANAIYKASVVATEIDVLITKAAASSVGSLDGGALEKAIADAKLGKSVRKELQSTIAGLVGKAGAAMDQLSYFTGKDIARSVTSAKESANWLVSAMETKGEIAERACKSLGIGRLDDPPTKEQADAVEAEKRKAFDEKFHEAFGSSNIGRALAAALKAQNEISDRLGDLMNGYVSDESARLDAPNGGESSFSRQARLFREKLDKLDDKAAGDILAVLEEAKFQCDRRVCELETLEMTLCDLVDATADNGEIDSSLAERDVRSLMADSAMRMHGNATVLRSLDAKVDGVAERIRGLGADTANVGQEQLDALVDDVKSLQRELAEIAAAGYVEIDVVDEAAPGPQQTKKARAYVDRTFVEQASKQVDEAAGKLRDFAANMRRETLTTMFEKSVSLHQFYIFDEKYLPLLKSMAPKTHELCRAVNDFEKACRAFIAAPSEKTEKAMHKIAGKVSADWLNRNLESIEVELCGVYKALSAKGSAMTPAEKDLRTALLTQFTDLVLEHKDVLAFLQFLDHTVASLDKAATLLAAESKKFTSADRTGMLVSGAVRNLFEGRSTLTTLVNARINGLPDGDADASFDDRNARSQEVMGSGIMNTVTLVSYNDGTERVFKPDAAGRIPLSSSTLVAEIDLNVSIANLNLATMKTAKAFGLEDAVVKTTVGVHDGQSGIFMEKARGVSGKAFARNTSPSSPDSAEYSLGDVRNMMNSPVGSEQRSLGERISAELMRQTTRLAWLDIISGQGDRHPDNFYVHLGKDGTVEVKGIDNDSCFSTHRTGLTTFVVKGADKFRDFMDALQQRCDSVFGKGSDAGAEAFRRLMRDPGLKVNLKGRKELTQRKADALFGGNDDGKDVESFSVDLSKITDPILVAAARDILGANALHVPSCMDEDTYNHIMAMDGNTEARRSYLADVKANLGEGDAYNNAVSRLDYCIRYARQLKEQGKVYGRDGWLDVVRGTTDADSEVRSELANKRQFVVNTGTATAFNREAANHIQSMAEKLMSSFYSKITT